jgi:acyl carrier protein
VVDIKNDIFQIILNGIESSIIKISDDTQLIGNDGILDSMKLVEICLMLEDFAEEKKFEFDWTSDQAMSKSRGMFRTAGSLAAEFINQMESKG